MRIIRKINIIHSAQEALNKIIVEFNSSTDSNRYDDLFVQLMRWLRTSRKRSAAVAKMELLLDALKKNPVFLASIRKMFQYFIQHKDFTSLFTETGVLNSSSFFAELNRAFLQKILPPLPEKNSMDYILVKAFDKNNDYRYVNAIPNNLWLELFKLVGTNAQMTHSKIHSQLLDAISLLSYRIMSLAFSKDLSQKWRASSEKYSVFIEQNRYCIWLVSMHLEGGYDLGELEKYYQLLVQKIDDCEALITSIGSNSLLYGTSLEQSYTIAKSKQQIVRMKRLLKIMAKNVKEEYVLNTAVLMFKNIIEYINKNSRLSFVVSRSMGLLAYQVTEHKRETGEHYITKTRETYYKLFLSAIYGGLIICVAAFIKAELHYYKFPDFWAYFLYGLNYTLAFIALYLTHSTLATKQPAMTAAALAAAIDGDKKSGGSEAKVSIVMARVWRSQFASFVGNLIVVFPVCIAIAAIYRFFFDHELLRPENYALEMLHAQHPGLSLCFLFAAFTGVFLYLSGIISGYVDNKVIYSNIPARIMEHPGLRRRFSSNFLRRISGFVRDHLGALVGNAFLGMALGFAPLIGKFFGIPFDIRHITISTAYYGFGVVGLDYTLTLADWVWVTIGVLGIGFINFFVSFGLAFFTAMRSRNLSMKDVPVYTKAVWMYFRKFPLDFIFPPKYPRIAEDIFKNNSLKD